MCSAKLFSFSSSSRRVWEARAGLCCVFTSSSVAGHFPEHLVLAPPAERDAALLLHSVLLKVFLLPVLPRLAWVCSRAHCRPHAAGEQCFAKLAVCRAGRLWARIEQTLSRCSPWLSAAKTLNVLFQIACPLSGCGQQRRSFRLTLCNRPAFV